jgi:hypothetical protein
MTKILKRLAVEDATSCHEKQAMFSVGTFTATKFYEVLRVNSRVSVSLPAKLHRMFSEFWSLTFFKLKGKQHCLVEHLNEECLYSITREKQ